MVPHCGNADRCAHNGCCQLADSKPGQLGRRRRGGGGDFLLSLVRHGRDGRRLEALAAKRQRSTGGDRVELVPGAGRLLLVRRGRRARTDARDRVDRRPDRDRLVVGAGIGGGRPAATRRARRARGRASSGAAHRAVRRPDAGVTRTAIACHCVKGVTDAYVYDSTTSADSEWKAANKQLTSLRLFANTNLPGKAEAGGFAGLYTYDVRIYDGRHSRVCARLPACATCSALPRSARASTPSARPVIHASRVVPTGRPMTACGVARFAPRPTSSRSRVTTNGTRNADRGGVGHRGSVFVVRRRLRPDGARRRALLPRPHGGVGAHLPRENRPLTTL